MNKGIRMRASGRRDIGGRVFRDHCLWIAGAFACGILINEQWRPDVLIAAGGSAAFLVFCLLLRKRDYLFFAGLMAAFVFLGMMHCRSMAYLPADHLYRIFLRDKIKDVMVTGVMAGDVKSSSDRQPRMTFHVDADHVVYADGYTSAAQGRVLVRSFVPSQVAPGDRVRISGRLHQPYDFPLGQRGSYKSYLRQNGIYLILTVGKAGRIETIETASGGMVVRLRERIKRVFHEHLPTFESGILRAILVGDRTGITAETRQLFVATGTAHVLAISGLHMGMIMGIFLLCVGFFPISIRWKYGSAVLLTAAYMPLAGGRASVMRSGVMAALFLCSKISERRFCSLNILGVAALAILLARPLDLYAAGFQLSFSATAALILFSNPFYAFFRRGPAVVPDPLIQAFSISLAAWLGTAGLVLYHFGTLTPISLLANLCIVGMMGVLISLGLLLVVAGLAGPGLIPDILSVDIQVVVSAMMRVISWMARLPFGHVEHLLISRGVCVGYYFFLIIWALVLAFLKARKPSGMRGLS